MVTNPTLGDNATAKRFIWVPFSDYGWTDFNIPATALEGDTIRLISASTNLTPIDFTITNVNQALALPGTYEVQVTPNPEDFALYTDMDDTVFSILRKVDIDNKVILSTPFLENTRGQNTPSSDGYLIPDDFTQENKDKVGKIIAILKGNNVFD